MKYYTILCLFTCISPENTFLSLNEDEEREFWSKHESTDYVDWSESDVAVFPKLKPTTKTISLRVPEYMLEELRTIANKRDVPYQSLIKIFLKERIDEELQTVD